MATKRVIGPFELGDRIGVGGMGIVYRAVYTKTGTPVAIKVLSPDLSNEFSLQKRFEREIAILKKLQHPHIVRYYGGGKIGSQRFYAMELVNGGSLERYLQEKQKLDWEEAVQFTLQIAQALEHAHEAGVIHRDLKPPNLLLTKDRQLKLTDFGIARDTTATALTAAGRTVGTYAYMAPEQIRGKPPVDKKTDLYALGCVMFEMLTGETPFTSENQGEMLMMHLNEEPRRVTSLAPNCPIWLEELIFDLLEKDPEKRPFDAIVVQMKLEEVLKKVEEQQSIAEATLKGEITRAAAGSGTTQGDLKDLLGKKKKKKKKDKSPFWEKAWFLSLCFLLFASALGGFTYTRMYPSEAALLSRVEKITNGADVSDWGGARNDLEQMLKRFPDGPHASKARDYLDQIEMNLAERQARKRLDRGADPENEGERLFLDADRIEKFGDRLLALERYESMVELLKKDDKYRPYVMLAQRQIAKIRSEGIEKQDRVKIVNQRLADAEELMMRDKIKARQIWQSIETLYGRNSELEPQVAHARKRIDGNFDGTWPPREAEAEEPKEE